MIAYADTGSGVPVVFIHGWAFSGRMFACQDALADGCRIIRADLPGHGDTPPSPQGNDIPHLGESLASFLESLRIVDAVLVCWSMGTLVMLSAFPRIASRLSGIVITGGTSRYCSCDGYPHGLDEREVRGLAASIRRRGDEAYRMFFRSMFSPAELLSLDPSRLYESSGIIIDRAASLDELDSLRSFDGRPMIPAVDVPVLIVHGTDDPICPFGAGAYLADRLPDASLVPVDGAGHAPFLTVPDRFNDILRTFIGGIRRA